jgi:hypothetical protein
VRFIADKILNWPPSAPLSTVVVAEALSGAFGLDIVNAKKITNVNMKRLADKGELVRIKKGIYGRIGETPFGKLIPNVDEIIAECFLRDGWDTIGYIAGPTLLNAIGLCSWIPKNRHIATNHYRRQLPVGTNISVHKPIAKVNNENAQYLQAIEMFVAMERYPFDIEEPDELLRNVMKRNNIDNEKLILLARKHCGHKTLLKTIDIALGGISV